MGSRRGMEYDPCMHRPTHSSPRARLGRAALVTAIAALAPAVALAHHPMGGRTPASFLDGLLSGLAHPLIGVDHLAMILLIGAYCGTTRQGLRPLLAFVGAALVGCLVHVARWDVPQAEAGVAVSLVLLGVAACTLVRPRPGVVLAFLGGFGLLHGYAYGESIVGAEATPLVAYLIGLGVVQAALGGLMWRVARPRREGALEPARLNALRALGLAGAAIGAAALL
jgi:urease accessory protein